MKHVKIPKDRVGVLIGPDGKTKGHIERRLGVRLLIDSEEGEVEVDDRTSEDPLAQIKAENVVRAIGRGFSPQNAAKLYSDDYYLELLDIHEFTGKNKDHVRRVTGRLVGTGGKTRKLIEDLTGCKISIYGHTVAIIGEIDGLAIAKEACSMILSGSEHASVYRYLENKRREQRLAEFGF
ncbi:MAG: KH domain-containing protein [Euryarchaeota archaeon]|nr:KH domain-containing protein [Euryarchaeota archaeon]